MAVPAEGMMVSGRYRLAEMIGEGGMARVFRAHDLTLDRPVAVKFLFLREDRDRETMIRRFLREARIAAAVRHPNVVDILDFGTTERDGRPFMVMELLEGQSLERRLADDPPVQLSELVDIVARTLDGLAAVHQAGIVHRDLKPENIFLHDDGGEKRGEKRGEIRPKLVDFGVSRDTDPSSGRRSALTTTDGYLVGTPEYMSPEQARGLEDVDHRTDIYSLGVVLYESITGVLPYEAEAVGDLIIEIVGGGAKPVHAIRPEVGEALSGVIATAMATDRDDRFGSAREMRDALVAAADASPGADALTTIRPARMGNRGPADVRWVRRGTLDSLEVPWGATAVPSFGRGPATEDELRIGASSTSDRWEVDAELPARRRPPRWPLFAAVVAVPLMGLASFWVMRSASPEAAVRASIGSASIESAPREAEIAPPAADRALEVEPSRPDPAEPEPEEASPATVHVTLRGLTPGARITVDGAAVEPDAEGMLAMPADDAEHEVRVAARGARPWTVRHRANGDGTYRVRLRPLRSRGERPRPSGGGGAEGDLFRDLDY